MLPKAIELSSYSSSSDSLTEAETNSLTSLILWIGVTGLRSKSYSLLFYFLNILISSASLVLERLVGIGPFPLKSALSSSPKGLTNSEGLGASETIDWRMLVDFLGLSEFNKLAIVP